MLKAISNTSPLLFLYRIDSFPWLGKIFDEVWIPHAVEKELNDAKGKGYDNPQLNSCQLIRIVDPSRSPSEWLSLDLGRGELSAMSLAVENPDLILLLDDSLARRTAIAAGLRVWSTLRVLLEAKDKEIIKSICPYIDGLDKSGMWISDIVRNRILKLAGER